MSDQENQPPSAGPSLEPRSDPPSAETETRPAAGMSYKTKLILGIASFWGIMLLTVAATASFRHPLPLAILPLSLIGLGAMAWRHQHWRGFALGNLIGLGLLALAAGLCAAIATVG